MKISVAMTTYNGNKYICEQLQSILGQTRKVDEVIIADDGSTDNTPKLISDFIQQNDLTDSWHFYVNEQNLGYAENFKKSIFKCSGDLIFFCDQDDVWMFDRVEEMVKQFEKNPQISVLYSKERRFNYNSNSGRWEYEQIKESRALNKTEFNNYTRYLRTEGCTMCVRREFADKIKPFWFSGWAHDEAVWSLAILDNSLYYYDYVSVKYRRHSANVSGNREHGRDKRVKYLKSVAQSSQTMIDYMGKESCNDILKTLRKTQKMAEYRLQLVEKRRLFKIIPLICYLKYYYSKKSFLVEIAMALKG